MAEWLTLEEARQIVRVGPKALRSAIKRGELRAARVNDRHDIRIHESWLRAWLEARSTPVEIVKPLRVVR